MLASLQRKFPTVVIAILLGFAGGAQFTRAADPQTDPREIIRAMGDSVIPLLANKGADPATRKEVFRTIYRANFDNAGIAATVAGRALQQATPGQRQQLLQVFENYVVTVYAAKLADYSGERLLVMRSEAEGNATIVTSLLVPPNPRAENIEIKWRLVNVGGSFKVEDVTVDKISMVLSQRHEFASLMREQGGTVDNLIAALRQKIGEAEAERAVPQWPSGGRAFGR